MDAAVKLGLDRDGGEDQLIGGVCEIVRPARPNGHGATWELLITNEEQIKAWEDEP